MTPIAHSFKQIILVTGPARSGKSEWAETLAARSQQSVTYIATAQLDSNDAEWQARILRHQQRRPDTWKTLSVPIDLAGTIQTAAAECLLIDSLGTWLSNILEQDEATWQQTINDLLIALEQTIACVIFVSEETGWGVVPAYPIGRLFRDRLGEVTRRIGGIADAVYLVTGGYALDLCQLGQSIDRSAQPPSAGQESHIDS